MEWFERFAEFVEDQPRLLRSAIWGGALLFGWTLLRSFMILPAAGPEAIGMAGIALLLATAAGAAGGFVHGLLRPLRRAGVIGEWLRWVAAAAVFLCLVAVAMVPSDPLMEGFFTDPKAWAAAAVMIALLAALGTWLFRGITQLSIKDPDTRSAKEILNEAVEADLKQVEKQFAANTELGRLDLIQKQIPSQAYVMHLWRITGRLGRAPAPTRQERLALKRARRLLREAEKQYQSARQPGLSDSATEGP
jgi:hypothetical protein